MSEQVAKHLYTKYPTTLTSNRVNYMWRILNKVQIEGNPLDAIGIFKSENKETYLKVYPEQNGFGMDYEENAININKLDKGVCSSLISKRKMGIKWW